MLQQSTSEKYEAIKIYKTVSNYIIQSLTSLKNT